MYFSLGDRLFWKISSSDSSWLKKNEIEFCSAKRDRISSNKLHFEIEESKSISQEENSSTLLINDKYSVKKIQLSIENNRYRIAIEKGFTFYYYAAFLDALIKLIALQKGIVPLHASALQHNTTCFIFCAYRRVGKTTVLLNLFKQNDELRILADDVVFLDKKGSILPYQRGIDLYPYLPISKKYIGSKERTQRILASIIQSLPFLSASIKTRIVKHSFLPRLNFAHFDPESSNEMDCMKKVFMLTISQSKKTSIQHKDRKALMVDVAKSSYIEIEEYQNIFVKHQEKYEDSSFIDLISNENEFLEKVNQALRNTSEFSELDLSSDYSELNELNRIIKIY